MAKVLRHQNLRPDTPIGTGGGERSLCLARGAPTAALCSELGALPGAVGDGVGPFPLGEVIFIIITGFCQYCRNRGGGKEKGPITNAIYQTTLVKILRFKNPLSCYTSSYKSPPRSNTNSGELCRRGVCQRRAGKFTSAHISVGTSSVEINIS